MKLLTTKIFFLSAIGFISLSSCNNSNEEIFKEKSYYIQAIAPGNPETRLSFEDENQKGVSVVWTKDDILTAYDTTNNERLYTLILIDGEGTNTGIFKCLENTSLGNDECTFLYADIDEILHKSTLSQMRETIRNVEVTQDGNGNMDHLQKNIWIEAVGNFENHKQLKFEHQLAMLTVLMGKPNNYSIENDGNPKSFLVTTNGQTYKLGLKNITWDEDIKVYLFVDPAEGMREINFKMETDKGATVYEFPTNTSVTYQKSKRYTALLKGEYLLQ